MSHKTRNIITLIVFLIIISALGIYLTFFMQAKKIKALDKEITKLNTEYEQLPALREKLTAVIKKLNLYDSLLVNSKKVLPFKTNITDVYNDLIKFSSDFSDKTKIDIEFEGSKVEKTYIVDRFNLKGIGTYEDVYNLIYSIEKSQKLYKINSITLSNQILQTGDGPVYFLVGFTIIMEAFSTNDKNLALNYKYKDEVANYVVPDIFYPLIMPEIPKNYNNLMELDGAELLALFYDGAFFVDKRGISYILQEGDEVYLGRLIKIDYEKAECEFILNKGGIIEKVIMKLKSDYQKGVKK